MVSATTFALADAMASAFSIPSADSRIGMIQVGRAMPSRVLISHDRAIHFRHLLGALNFRNQNQIRAFANHFRQIFEAERQLVDAHHALAFAEIHRPQRVSHQNAGRVFLVAMHRIFEVENYRIRLMERGVDEVFRLRTGQIKTRTTQATLRGRGGQ